MDFNQFLVYLMGGGSIIAASWILERWKKYQAQSPENKQYIFFGIASLIGVIAYLTATYVPSEIIVSIVPIFKIVGLNFTYIFLGSVFHTTDKTSENTKALG